MSKKLPERCECGKEPARIEGAIDLWWLFDQAQNWQHRRWNKRIKYVAVCPDLFCNYSTIVYNGQPSPDLVKHLEMWQPLMTVLAQEYYTWRYNLSDKQWKARRVPKRGFQMAPLPHDTFDEKGRRIRKWKPPKGN